MEHAMAITNQQLTSRLNYTTIIHQTTTISIRSTSWSNCDTTNFQIRRSISG